MPKLRKATEKTAPAVEAVEKVTSKDLLRDLYQMRDAAQAIIRKINYLEVVLCTKGLADAGPVVEDDTDCPF